ncbi:STAS domain-containing protein [Micromonospora sp. NPDC047707]|uniref:STAS domain-containing protein n=1 Tax=unclassified Micromonospora TaxID=2617518 RepID=UPI0034538208
MTTPAPGGCRLSLVEVRITECDLACVPQVEALCGQLLALRPARLVVDLSECRHIDAAAVGHLIDLNRRLRQHGGRLIVSDPAPRVHRVLRLLRVDQDLSIVSGRSWPGASSGRRAAVELGGGPVT